MADLEQKYQELEHKVRSMEGLIAEVRRDLDDLTKSQERVAVALTGSLEHDKPGVLTNVRDHTRKLDDLSAACAAMRGDLAEVRKLASDGPSTQEFTTVKDAQSKQGRVIERLVIYGTCAAFILKMAWDWYLTTKK